MKRAGGAGRGSRSCSVSLFSVIGDDRARSNMKAGTSSPKPTTAGPGHRPGRISPAGNLAPGFVKPRFIARAFVAPRFVAPGLPPAGRRASSRRGRRSPPARAVPAGPGVPAASARSESVRFAAADLLPGLARLFLGGLLRRRRFPAATFRPSFSAQSTGSSPSTSIGGIGWSISFSICSTAYRSSGAAMVRALPSSPARPVRPMRWT